jgi:hypothetical protein
MKKRIGLLKPVTWLVSGNLQRLTPLALYFLEPPPLLALFSEPKMRIAVAAVNSLPVPAST